MGLTPFEDLREPLEIWMWILIEQFDEERVVIAAI